MNRQHFFAWVMASSLAASSTACRDDSPVGSGGSSPAGGSNGETIPGPDAAPRAGGPAGQAANPDRAANNADTPSNPDTPDVLQMSALQASALQQQLDAAQTMLAGHAGLDAQGLLVSHPISFETALGYAPETALNLDLIQNSELALDQNELAALSERGFVISDQRTFQSYGHGYTDRGRGARVRAGATALRYLHSARAV